MVWPGDQWIRATMRCAENPVSTPTAILRRDLLDRIGGYDETLPHSGDLLMWLQAASMADVAYVSGVDLAYYRVHGSNMHTTNFGALHSDLSERARAFATFADEGSADRTELLCVARRALAREAEAALARIGTGDAAEVDPLRTFVEEQLAAAGSTSARRMSPRLPRSARALLDPSMSAANWRVWRRFGMRW
jgi:hypothetical protein